MLTNIQKHGNSLYLRIPSDIAKKHEIKDKTSIDVHETVWDIIFRKE